MNWHLGNLRNFRYGSREGGSLATSTTGILESNWEDDMADEVNEARELTVRQLQSSVDQWIKTVGVRYFSELTNLAILMEEVGELSRIIARTFGDQSFKKSDEAYNLSDEMADVLFVLVCLANQTGVDLESAIRANLDKKTQRDANRHLDNPKLRPTNDKEF